MIYGKHTLQEMEHYYIELREKCSIELRHCPRGNLICSKCDGRDQFYVAERKNNTYAKRGINRNPELIMRLARKKFLEKTIREIDENISVLAKAKADFRECDATEIINSMTKAYGKLSVDLFFNSKAEDLFGTEDQAARARYERHREWANAQFEKSDYRGNELIELTSRGELVRSKAEALVAELCYRMWVPFRYEDTALLKVCGTVPDFTFETRCKGYIYLEFCGMMDDEGYIRRFLEKRRRYERAGINEWTNMIYIYESENTINMKLIEATIELRIIPYL